MRCKLTTEEKAHALAMYRRFTEEEIERMEKRLDILSKNFDKNITVINNLQSSLNSLYTHIDDLQDWVLDTYEQYNTENTK